MNRIFRRLVTAIIALVMVTAMVPQAGAEKVDYTQPAFETYASILPIETVYYTDQVDMGEFPEEKVDTFLREFVPTRGLEGAKAPHWDDFYAQWDGTDFIFSNRCQCGEYKVQPAPDFDVANNVDYVVGFLSHIIMAEDPHGPSNVQYGVGAVAMIRSNLADQPLEFTYNQAGQYDQVLFDLDEPIPSETREVAQRVVDDYLNGTLAVSSKLYCQSLSYWGDLVEGWYRPSTGEYEFFSTGEELTEEEIYGYIE